MPSTPTWSSSTRAACASAPRRSCTRASASCADQAAQGHDPIVAVAGCVAQQEGEAILRRSRRRRRRHRRHAGDPAAPDARRAGRENKGPGRFSPPAIDLDPVRGRDVSARRHAARRSRQGLRDDHRGLQRVLQLLRRAVHARARAHAPEGRHPGGGARGRGGRAPRGAAARTDRQSLRGARRSRLRLHGPARGRPRGARARADPLREPASAPRLGAVPRRDGATPEDLPAPAPARAVRVDARARGDAPPLHARELPRADRPDSRDRAGRRALDRYDRRVSGRDRRRLRGDAVADRGRAVSQHVLVQVLAAAEHAGREAAGRRCARGGEDEADRGAAGAAAGDSDGAERGARGRGGRGARRRRQPPARHGALGPHEPERRREPAGPGGVDWPRGERPRRAGGPAQRVGAEDE